MPYPGICSAAALKGGFVSVMVGEPSIEYSVHKTLLEKESGFFRVAFNGQWKEATEKVIKLKDVEPAVFSIFVNWIYTGQLPQSDNQWINPDDKNIVDMTDDSRDSETYDEAEVLRVKAIVFGDRYAPRFLNAVQNDFVGEFIEEGCPPYNQTIIVAFRNLPSHYTFLTFLVNAHCAFWIPDDLWMKEEKETYNQLPPDFFVRVMKRHAQLRDESKHRLDPNDYNPENYNAKK